MYRRKQMQEMKKVKAEKEERKHIIRAIKDPNYVRPKEESESEWGNSDSDSQALR